MKKLFLQLKNSFKIKITSIIKKPLFLETLIGLIIGTSIGLLLAILLWWNKTIAKIFDPFLIVLNAFPKNHIYTKIFLNKNAISIYKKESLKK